MSVPVGGKLIRSKTTAQEKQRIRATLRRERERQGGGHTPFSSCRLRFPAKPGAQELYTLRPCCAAGAALSLAFVARGENRSLLGYKHCLRSLLSFCSPRRARATSRTLVTACMYRIRAKCFVLLRTTLERLAVRECIYLSPILAVYMYTAGISHHPRINGTEVAHCSIPSVRARDSPDYVTRVHRRRGEGGRRVVKILCRILCREWGRGAIPEADISGARRGWRAQSRRPGESTRIINFPASSLFDRAIVV